MNFSFCWIACCLLGLSACLKQDEQEAPHPLMSYQFSLAGADAKVGARLERVEAIKAGARAAGLNNAVLLAGIANAETSLAHCWSEATWACQGPASVDCRNGPVIAGSGDGVCSLKQGGLCMFQFDAGTHAQTLKQYGQGVLTVQGCTGAVVPFLVRRAIQSVPNIANEADALAWMNRIVVAEGDPSFEAWIRFVSWRYNGCKGCANVEAKYRKRTLAIHQEFGQAFWNSPASDSGASSIPDPVPSGEQFQSCQLVKVINLPDLQTLKLRSDLTNASDANVLTRIPAGSVAALAGWQNGPSVQDDLQPSLASNIWLKVSYWDPRGAKHEGFLAAIYAKCMDGNDAQSH